jgi:protein-S-isoprenylcysteine O-methyltransferase Ste14
MATLELKVPPPIVALTMLAVMWIAARAVPAVDLLGRGRIPMASALALLGIALIVTGARQFRGAQTTVNPRHPESASVLVTSGVYRVTRNPMYVGLVLVLVGWAVALASPLTLLGPVLFVAYLTRYQIRPEERVLLAKFGDRYRDYTARVRRWI